MRKRRYFTSSTIARSAHFREDAAWIAERFESPTAQVLLVANGAVAIAPDDARPRLAWLPASEYNPHRAVFLGMDGEGQPRFAVRLDDDDAEPIAARHGLKFQGLRSAAAVLEDDEVSLGAYARGMDLWHRNHRFCGVCGSRTQPDQAGFRRRCAACGREHFPRLDPAVITAVTYDHQLLLGRQPTWPPGWYSVLAGFVEPGETLEEAVRREVDEEAGVAVGDVSYHGSQPWPFPSSVMIGFRAAAKAPEITLGDELDDVQWFDVDRMRSEVQAGALRLSPGISISRDLIDDFVHSETGEDTHDWTAPQADPWRRD